MATLKTVRPLSWYTSGRNDVIDELYLPCLSVSTRYDRAVGYFTSSVYAVMAAALSEFAERGGSMRLICSPCLTDDDIGAIRQGLSLRDKVDEALLRELHAIIASPTGRSGVELLSTLLAAGLLKIRIAYRPGASGIFHSKVGLFSSEDGAKVAFVGSGNETMAAVSPEHNAESFMAFNSWSGEADAERVEQVEQYFEALWNSREPGLEVCEFPEVPRSELEKHRNPQGVKSAIQNVRTAWRTVRQEERPSRAPQLLAHQATAVANWEANGHCGIVAHATGAGKTLTALTAIGRWLRDGNPAIVLVPSDLLSRQWLSEARRVLSAPVPRILVVGGSASSAGWQADLPDFTRNAAYLGPRIVIATMQSASTERFRKRVVGGPHLMVVADEVHRIGSPQFSRILEIASGARLGLSATPIRYGDPAGSQAIVSYFGQVLEPPFGIADGILAGRLVPYDYHVHTVPLTKEEEGEWDEMTRKIQKAYARLPTGADGRKIHSQQYKLLLIRRAAIAKRASGKIGLARSVLDKEYHPGDRWLVYCDTSEQLSLVREALVNMQLPALEYWSAMEGARNETLDYFSRNGGVVVAIKCLDEGVDLPNVDHALILASSSNPREFIQRRGRVLRRSEGKYSAEIHDALVMPSLHSGEVDRLPILRVEITRAMQFARDAQNRGVYHRLRKIAVEAGLVSLNDPASDFEEDQSE